MTTTLYQQCLLRKRIDRSTTHSRVTWLPQQYAVANQVVKLRGTNGTWVDGWVVKVAGNDAVPESRLPDAHAAVRGHRRRTGDAEPRIGST